MKSWLFDAVVVVVEAEDKLKFLSDERSLLSTFRFKHE